MQDLTLRNKDLEPILDLEAIPFTRIHSILLAEVCQHSEIIFPAERCGSRAAISRRVHPACSPIGLLPNVDRESQCPDLTYRVRVHQCVLHSGTCLALAAADRWPQVSWLPVVHVAH